MKELCKKCGRDILPEELFYCYICGAPHHENCFVSQKICGTGTCISTVCVSNSDGRTINCLSKDSDDMQDSDAEQVSVLQPDSMVGKSLKAAEKDTSPILMVASMLFSLVIFLLATVWFLK